MNGWRGFARYGDPEDFIKDQVVVFLAKKNDNGIQFVKPIQVELNDVTEPSTVSNYQTSPSLTIDNELANVIFECLANVLLQGESIDLVSENRRLKSELTKAEFRLDNLIKGIGNMKGNS